MTREEAIEIIKNRFDKWALDDKDLEAIQTLIPELAESEDERVINELQAFLASYGADYFGTGRWQKFEDWLEKQKEQEPAEWSEEDEDMLNSCISSIEEAKENRYAYKETDGDTSYDHEIAWLKLLRNRVGKEFLQPHWKPSEEQLITLLNAANGCYINGTQKQVLMELYNDLQKLM